MKGMKWIIWNVGIAFTICLFNSCTNDKGYSLDDAWYSIATIRTEGYGATSYWLTLDSGTSLWPVATNVPLNTPKDKERAFVLYTILYNSIGVVTNSAGMIAIFYTWQS